MLLMLFGFRRRAAALAAASDTELVALVLTRQEQPAFAELVRRHQGAIRGFLRRLCGGDESRGDDLAQETFLHAYRGLLSYQGHARFSTWLHTIAYRCFLVEQRTRSRRPPEVAGEVGIELAAAHAGPGDAAMVQLNHDVDRALLALRPEERAAVVLCCLAGLSHGEAAQVLGCPLGTVKTHVLHGRELLRERLRAWEEVDS